MAQVTSFDTLRSVTARGPSRRLVPSDVRARFRGGGFEDGARVDGKMSRARSLATYACTIQACYVVLARLVTFLGPTTR